MPNPASSYRSADPAEIDRNAYNAAFYELGLRWHWDIDTYNELRTTRWKATGCACTCRPASPTC
jgi:hypothetical protein